MTKRPIETIVLDDSDDERDPVGDQDEFEAQLARAIALSKRESDHAGSSSSTQVKGDTTAATVASASTSSAGGASTSRQEMEQARLERQQQREASGASMAPRVSLKPAVKRPKVQTLSDLQDSPAEGLSTATSSSGGMGGFASASAQSRNRSATRFWSGAIKPVANQNVPGAGYSFAAIIDGGEELEMAIVGAFCVDPEWVCSHFNATTPLLLVKPRGGDDKEGPLALVDPAIKPQTYRVIPQMRAVGNPNYACMHTKIIVLYFKTFCRIIIPTANAVDYDWAVLDNAFYVHDFPARTDTATISPDPRNNPTHTQFSREFLEVMHSLDVPKRFVASYKKWDFSSSKDIRLIPTRQGIYHGWDEIGQGAGLPGLASQVASLGFSKGGKWEIEATGSSIGTTTSNWLAQMMGAAEGYQPRRYFSKKQPTPPHHPQLKTSIPTKLPIKIVWPTLQEIDDSWGGQGHGGTIFFPSRVWNMSTFPRHLLYKGVSKKSRVTAHTKMIVAVRKPTSNSGSDFKHEGWVYVGSHNFTSAAWGKLQTASRDGEPELSNNNYELGVILPVRGTSEQDVENKISEMVTFKRPLEKYGKGDTPWMQDQSPLFAQEK